LDASKHHLEATETKGRDDLKRALVAFIWRQKEKFAKHCGNRGCWDDWHHTTLAEAGVKRGCVITMDVSHRGRELGRTLVARASRTSSHAC